MRPRAPEIRDGHALIAIDLDVYKALEALRQDLGESHSDILRRLFERRLPVPVHE